MCENQAKQASKSANTALRLYHHFDIAASTPPRCSPPHFLASFARRPLWSVRPCTTAHIFVHFQPSIQQSPIGKHVGLASGIGGGGSLDVLSSGGASSFPVLLLLCPPDRLPPPSCIVGHAPPAIPPTNSLLNSIRRPTGAYAMCRRRQ